MTEEKTKQESYSLSDSKRSELISGLKDNVNEEGNEELEEFAQKLSKSRENVEKGEAWISSIVPPGSGDRSSPEEIKVEFLLPSGDTFWESYDYSSDYMSDQNNFVKLVNHVGHDLNALEYVVGQSVEIEYDERRESWEVDQKVFRDEADGNEEEEQGGLKKKLGYGVGGLFALALSVPIVILIVRTRGLALIILMVLMAAIYMIYLAFNQD